ncbi:MAG: 4-hydroxy-tetrahydrodipicolinate reductase [SAR202 cluster bacterium]|nr:4-hydroxy-tetrahydrodipicolinate reductase [SAR202 cluster bacterium]
MTTEALIRVAVHGAAGRVGREVLGAVSNERDMRLVAAIDRVPQGDLGPLGHGVPYFTDAEEAFRATKPHVVVDFTNAAASMGMVPHAFANGVRPVIGSTGWSQQQLDQIAEWARERRTAAFIAPNFTIGAVLLGRLSAIAAKWFDYCEIAEEHHEKKIDAPSGTALAIAEAVHREHPERFVRNTPEREPLGGTRGGDYHGISMHSGRMPGRMARHQVTFGGLGQTLVLTHDTIDRECYMPGVLLAVRRAGGLDGLVVGLEKLLDV